MAPKPEENSERRTQSDESEQSKRQSRSKIRSYERNDITDGPLEVGDRCLIKEKYVGTCKYIGPIEEKIISEEIFVGIELDECITKNSGVFGSRQYFDCPYGYGIMVPLKKARKIKDYSKKAALKTMRSRSISNINRMKIRDEEGKTLRKVSPGYDFIKRSKSSSNLDKSKEGEVFSKGTFEILDDYKTYQEKERDAFHKYYSSRYACYNDIDQIYDTMGLENYTPDAPHPDWDMMRQSFLKIVKPRGSRSYSTSLDESFPNRSSFASFDSGHGMGNGMVWPVDPAFDDKSFPYSSQLSSRRTSTVVKPRRKREVITVRKYKKSEHLSDSSGIESYDEKPERKSGTREEEPILQAFVALRRNICDECANCKKCTPAEMIPIDEVDKIRKMEFLPVNTCPEVAVKSHKKKLKKSTSRRSSGIGSQHPSEGEPTSQKSDLKEQWRAKHGCHMEQGMTRGFNKLMYAING